MALQVFNVLGAAGIFSQQILQRGFEAAEWELCSRAASPLRTQTSSCCRGSQPGTASTHLASQGLLELPAVLPAWGNTNGFGKEGDIATRSLMLLQAQPGRGSSWERSWALLLPGFKHVLSLSSHSH